MTVTTTFIRPSWRDPNYPYIFNRVVIPCYQCICKKEELKRRLKIIESIEGSPGLAEDHDLTRLLEIIDRKNQSLLDGK